MKRTSKEELLIVVVCTVIAIICLSIALISSAKEPVAYEKYIVKQGDTLWDIADERTDGDIRKAVYIIKQDNSMVSSSIERGQALKLRKGY